CSLSVPPTALVSSVIPPPSLHDALPICSFPQLYPLPQFRLTATGHEAVPSSGCGQRRVVLFGGASDAATVQRLHPAAADESANEVDEEGDRRDERADRDHG